VSGVGLHSGAAARVTLVPADAAGAGVVFVPGGGAQEIPARASNVVETARCTVLGGAAGRIATVEHLLSALAGMGVDDCRVVVEGPELPIGDGSALLWTEALGQAGVVELPGVPGVLPPLVLDGPLVLGGPGGSFVAAFPSDTPRWTAAIAFDHPLVGVQVARFGGAGADYAAEVAPARTFGFAHEIEALRAAGLARGGSLDNALVVFEDRFSAPLRFDDEFARHKLLDLMGDLALAGVPLVADVFAVKPSHRLNTEFARLVETRAMAAAGGAVADPSRKAS
jgi:UDP-3-O-[3-hydroxymyristoyl] N-acetylglucosamine deacetylase